MDKSISEIKQAAATSADLLQQKPHVEVIQQSHLLLLQMRRDWLQTSQRFDCKPRDFLERSGKGLREKGK
jgi:hypothetical protein